MVYKSELATKVAEKVDMPVSQVDKVISSALDTIIEEVSSGESVQLTGFGSFQVSHRAERTGRNMSTGEVITIPATVTPSFKAGKTFKDAVKQK